MLHRFDHDGDHTGSEIWCSGTSEHEADSIDKAETCLNDWLDALPGRVHGDIAIKLFQVKVDGQVFGLVDWSHLYDGREHAEFLPDSLGFDPPWDGVYDT